MNTALKFALAAWLAPSLVAGVVALTIAVAAPLWWVGGMLALVVLLVGLIATSAAALKRWLRWRFSPVRRRHPRPTAWRQWR